jgi:hypothetical protein
MKLRLLSGAESSDGVEGLDDACMVCAVVGVDCKQC